MLNIAGVRSIISLGNSGKSMLCLANGDAVRRLEFLNGVSLFSCLEQSAYEFRPRIYSDGRR